ncbi:hypothetical protein Bca52824_071641 [Brassica carinata]|uniref:Uncharacterized protein n=1 Tax=Brassica carinata TaxID=52824 RepID=A0A8X7Q733_BRACI|nr:hypothetical protein Bca52824_071641 [Brassica carinata]
MAYFFLLLDDVKTWRCSTTEVHLLRVWEAEPLKQAPAPAEECKERRRAYMLLLDVEACSIYAESGVSGFDVTPINPNYKLSNSPPSICFSDLTDFDEITEPVSSIPQELFQFSDYEQLQHIFLKATSSLVMTMRKIQLLKQPKVVYQVVYRYKLHVPYVFQGTLERHTLNKWRMQFFNHSSSY